MASEIGGEEYEVFIGRLESIYMDGQCRRVQIWSLLRAVAA